MSAQEVFYRGARYFIVIFVLFAVSGRVSGQATVATGSGATASRPSDPAGKDQSAQPAQVAPGHAPIHIVPFGPPATPPTKLRKPIGGSSNNGTVQYWGGPVISNVHVVEVLWGSFVDTPSTTGLDQFFTDVTQSNYFGLLAEYGTVGLTGFGGTGGSNQTIGPGLFDIKVTISPSMCPGGVTNPPCTINDTQIETEIVNQLNAHHLPTPVQDNQGNFNTIYMVYFPPGVTIVLAPGINSCQAGGFCAYHSNVVLNLQPLLPYGVFPDFGPTSGCSAAAHGCGGGTSQQNLTSASSHELAESVTDVDVGSATAFAPPLAWADQNTGEEIGDFCNNLHAQITVNSNTYTVQTQWSNMQGQCVSAPAHLQLTAPGVAIPGQPISLTVTAQSSVANQQLSGYNDTVHFTSSDTLAVLPPDYTFAPLADHGTHTFAVTLNTIGNQTVTATDTLVLAMTGSSSTDAEHNPDLTVVSSHSGSFTQGQTGATYTLTVTNTGDRATDGSQVRVNENVPFGLTFSAINGTGWTCDSSGTPQFCTRSDALAAGSSYPPITVTVNVANNAPPAVFNTVTVSGGGELNTSNDSSSDRTLVIQLPDLSILMLHGGSFAQGQLGETYTITVLNSGSGFTTGTVNVTDNLPTGLTATAIGGQGWSCSTPPTLTCSRSDALPPFNVAYPTITVTVNVDSNAPMPTVTNTATVSGGGEVNTSNDTVNDPTTITLPVADLIMASTHSGSFTQGQTGAYQLTVSNIGPSPTSGTVTATDSLPSGLTATGMSGTGWTCNLLSVSCTRSDALAGNTTGTVSSYPPITLSVSVSASAPNVVTNLANASGGGELNTGNDGASDPTTITPAPDLQLLLNFTGMGQGETGVVVSATAQNLTGGTTTGTVTVVYTLPAGFTATALTGNGWTCVLNSLTCTRSDALGPFGSYPATSVTFNIAINAPPAFTLQVTVSGGGEANTGNDISTIFGTLGPPIAINPVLGTLTVSAGGTANFTLNVFSEVTGTATLSCSGLPLGAACNFTPSSVNQPATLVALAITTSGPSLGSVRPLTGQRTPFLAAFFLPLLAVAAIAGAGRRRRWYRRMPFLGLAAIAVLLALAGCGGSGGPPKPPPVVTPPGTYTITVTAVNSSVNTQGTATLTLIVR